MQVEILYLTAVDLFAQQIVGLIGQAFADNVSFCQRAIKFSTDRHPSRYLLLTGFLWQSFCQCKWYSFGITGWRKTAGADVHTIFDQCGHCFGSHDFCVESFVLIRSRILQSLFSSLKCKKFVVQYSCKIAREKQVKYFNQVDLPYKYFYIGL